MKLKIMLLILSFFSTVYLQPPSPDSTTFFPLQKGSYWVYEQFLEGAIQKGNRETDSVIDVVKKDNVLIAKIERKREQGKNKIFEYIIDENGVVFLKKKTDSPMEKFCQLLPHPADSVANLRYSSYLDSNKTIIRLETKEYDNAKQEEKLEWQGRTYKKGIGMVSFGGPSLGMDLVRYRIGSSNLQIYKKK